MERSEVIRWLSIIRENIIYLPEISNKQKIESLDYAISSLKTDEAYQIMYEGGEVFTKDEVIGMFKEIQDKFIDVGSTGWLDISLDEALNIFDKYMGENKENDV